MKVVRGGCLSLLLLVVGVPLLFFAWYTEWILPPSVTCSMADQEACPDVGYSDIEWRDPVGPRVISIDFTDWDPAWHVSPRRMQAAEWVALAEVYADPARALACNPGEGARIICVPVEEIDEG